MLFGDDASHGTDVVLTERAHSLRSHAAQVAFPGGHLDEVDDGPVDAAVREAEEEAGIDPSTVEIISTLPPLYMHPTGTSVTPVLAWWQRPHPLIVGDPAEVARVVRAPVRELLDPSRRFSCRLGPYRGPGFDVCDLYVWGFTATLLDHVLDLAGLTTPWDSTLERPIPPHLTRAYSRK